MRTWEEYKQAWSNEIERLHHSDNQLDKQKYTHIEQGLEMSCIPPVGVELSITEYRQLKEAGYDLQEIHGWCYSGKDMHERVRPYNVGTTSPRKGFYYVRQINNEKAVLVCYYNYKNRDEFLEEPVEISKIPLYNYVSLGPKKKYIGVGDIIEVQNNPVLVEYSQNRQSLNSYKIEWTLIKHPKLSPFECDKIRSEIEKLKEEGYYCESILSDAENDRAEARTCIKDKLDLPFTDDDVRNAQNDLIRIKEQIAYCEGVLDNCGV